MKSILFLSLILSTLAAFAKLEVSDTKDVPVSYYGLSYFLQLGDHGEFFSIQKGGLDKMRISIRGKAAKIDESCLPIAPRLDLEISTRPNGLARVQLLPSTVINGVVMGTSKNKLVDFHVASYERKHSGLKTFSVSVAYENGYELDFDVNGSTAVLTGHKIEEDHGRLYSVYSLSAESHPTLEGRIYTIRGKCYQ